MKKSHFVYIMIIVISIASVAVVRMSNKKPIIEVRCSGELLSRRKLSGLEPSELHTTVFLFLYESGKGFLTQKGELQAGGNTYIVDREMQLNYDDIDKDGIYKFEVTKSKVRTKDNLPQSISSSYPLLGKNSADYYMSMTTLDDGLYVFNELSTPVFLCKRF